MNTNKAVHSTPTSFPHPSLQQNLSDAETDVDFSDDEGLGTFLSKVTQHHALISYQCHHTPMASNTYSA